jgi:hypothetical protein
MNNVSEAAQTVVHSGSAMALVAKYEATKIAIATWVGIDDWLIHSQFGMIIFVLSAIALRKPLGSLLPVTLVVVGEGLNEYLDKLNYGSWRWPDTSRDLIFTIGWPFILFLCARIGLLRRD